MAPTALIFFLFLSTYTKAEENVCTVVKSRTVWKCPNSKFEYEKASKEMNCEASCGAEYRFHCIRDNRHEHLYHVCAVPTIITGHCAEYNVKGRVVQNDHNIRYKYDNVYINSSDIYKYPFCLHIPFMENKERRDLKDHHKFFHSDGIPLKIFIVVIILVCVSAVFFSILCYERFSKKISWMEAFRRVTRCFICQRTGDETNDTDTVTPLF